MIRSISVRKTLTGGGRLYSTAGIKPISLLNRNAFETSTRDNKLWTFLNKSLDDNKIKLTPITTSIKSSDINLPETLPITTDFKSREDVSEVPRWRRSLTLWIRIGKKLIRLYRDSIQTTIRVYRGSSDIDTSDILRKLQLNITDHLITRKKFVQDVIRKNEIYKIPRFFLTLLIFEEITLVLMYLKPRLGLHRCLGLKTFNKLSQKYSKQANVIPNPMRYNTVHSIPNSIKLKLLKSLVINNESIFKYRLLSILNAPNKLNKLLAKYLQYLIVDDWLLLRELIIHGELSLSYNELVNCVLERQLYYKDEDLNYMVSNDEDRYILIYRLFCYWSYRFDTIDLQDATLTFTDRWGVNNISLLNYSGVMKNINSDSKQHILFEREHLNYLK